MMSSNGVGSGHVDASSSTTTPNSAGGNYLPPGVSPELLAQLHQNQQNREGTGIQQNSDEEDSDSSQEALDPNDMQSRAWIAMIEEKNAMSEGNLYVVESTDWVGILEEKNAMSKTNDRQ
jgi:hypothetical protein